MEFFAILDFRFAILDWRNVGKWGGPIRRVPTRPDLLPSAGSGLCPSAMLGTLQGDTKETFGRKVLANGGMGE